jgi:hypothetical protein
MKVMSTMTMRTTRMGIGGSVHGGRPGRCLVAALALLVALGTARPAAAAEGYTGEFGLGIGAAFIDLVYMPIKVVYATLGGITGGFAFLLTGGRMDIAQSIWRPSLGGTYVITPKMLRGDEPIYFSGGADEASRDDAPPTPQEERLDDRDHGKHGEAY